MKGWLSAVLSFNAVTSCICIIVLTEHAGVVNTERTHAHDVDEEGCSVSMLETGRGSFKARDAREKILMARARQDPTAFQSTVTLNGFEDLAKLEDAVAQSLLQHDYAIVNVKMPAWQLPLDKTGDAPYTFQFQATSGTEGQYKEHDSMILISANPSAYFRGLSWYGQTGDPAIGNQDEVSAMGFGSGARKVAIEEAKRNIEAKHMVVHVYYPECGYFAHAMANVLPRFSAILPAARRAGYKVSVVIPSEGRAFFSGNTQAIFEGMGVEVLDAFPTTPHRAVGLSLLAPWDHVLRQGFQQELRRGFLSDATPANCNSQEAHKRMYLSRKSGARNGRWIPGTELLEQKLASDGFEIVDGVGDIPISKLAHMIYQCCTLASFGGGQLLNLVFLPPGATVVEYNPSRIYSDRWLYAHALNYKFKDTVPSSVLDAQAAADLANFAISP